MKTYYLVDSTVGVRCQGVMPLRMSEEQALLENRDLYLQGRKSWGWIDASQVAESGRVTKPQVKQPPAVAQAVADPDLVAALIALGYKEKKARELAGTVPAGESVDAALQKIFAKVKP